MGTFENYIIEVSRESSTIQLNQLFIFDLPIDLFYEKFSLSFPGGNFPLESWISIVNDYFLPVRTFLKSTKLSSLAELLKNLAKPSTLIDVIAQHPTAV